MSSDFGFGKVVETPFDVAIENVTAELEKEGFGILSDIDVAAKMKAKLDEDMPGYRILGACHPPSAYRALTAVPEVGVLLPCNVTVSVENGRTVVRAMNPKSAMGILDNPELAEVAVEVGDALVRVVRSLEG